MNKTRQSTVPGKRAHFEGRRKDEADWQALLPDEWRNMVIAPLRFKAHREYEMTATRCFGYDADDTTCYYAYHFVLNRCCSDDDEDFYETVSYGETLHAWRLRDDRWLIHRIIHTGGDEAPARGFYSFAEQYPR